MSAGPGRIVYFDNAATSWPKPEAVFSAMDDWQRHIGGSPGRSGHRMSIGSSRILEDVRSRLAALFRFPDPLRLVFTKNITEALNAALFSLAPRGGHVVVPAVEHNSLMRPLRHLERTAGIELTLVPAGPAGRWSVEAVLRAVRSDTALVAAGHASNVTGMRMPVGDLWRALAEKGVPLVVDGAQSAGAVPVDLSGADNVVYAFTGHKALLGPTGTGGMAVGAKVDVFPLLHGGTGSRSDEDVQPAGYPDSLESGTMNMLGIAGLGGALSFLAEEGVSGIRERETALMSRFLDSVRRKVPGLTIYGAGEAEECVSTVSFTMKNLNPSQAGFLLDRKYGILCRIGMHCNPNCHRSIGTFPEGTVRFSFSPFTTADDIDYAADCLAEMAALT